MNKKVNNIKIKPSIIFNYLILLILVIFFALPFYWMIVLSTHTSDTILSTPPPLLFGNKFLINYDNLMDIVNFCRSYLNSIYVSIVSTVLTLLFCSMAGFAFAFYEFPGKKIIFILLLITLMLPWIVSLIPWFIIISKIGWVNEHAALIIPGAANAFGIFWMRQYIGANCPRELMDSARMDGCPEFFIFFRIFTPIIKPAYGALGIMVFVQQWNNFFYPMVVLQSRDKFTLPLSLSLLLGDPYKGMDFGVMMTGASLVVVPVIIIFIFFSKRIISGLTSGAVKG